MPSKLKNLVITKVALVDEGSCSAAHIKLYKRKEGGQVMNYEEILKSLPEDQRAVVTAAVEKAKTDATATAKTQAEKDAEDAIDGGIDEAMENPDGTMAKGGCKKSIAKVATKVKALNAEIAKLKGDASKSDEEILKGLDPAVRAIIEKSNAKVAAAEASIKKMAEEKDNVDFLAKAKEVAFVPEADTKVVDLLKSVKGVDGAVDKVMELLKSANTLIAKGAAFKEIGGNGSGEGSSTSEAAWDAIEKAAANLVAKGLVSKAKAIEMVMTNQPELYKTYVDALRAE